jgi:phosphoglycolate phosphatase-like HAD superfamily hydrolase
MSPPNLPTVQWIRAVAPRPQISHVVFDFDGTLSWLRHGWPGMMLDLFRRNFPARPAQSPEDVDRLLVEGILSLNGKPTIFQMRRFVEMVAERDGARLDADSLRRQYQQTLDEAIARRSARIRSGACSPDDFVVHGARRVIEHLKNRSLTLVVLSSTEEDRVREEAALLDIAPLFEPRIFGSTGDPTKFSKRALLDRVLSEAGASGEALLSFGDGPAEIADTKALGGVAVAVCTDEEENGSGRCDPNKQQELIAAGADVVIPDFRDAPALADYLLGRKEDVAY